MLPTTSRHGFWVGFFFTLNSTLGTGILTIPWSFQYGGLVLSSALLLVAAGLTLILSMQMLEIMSRIELHVQLQTSSLKPLPEDDIHPLLPPEPTITDRKFDMEEMFGLVYNPTAEKAFLLVFVLSMFGILTAYCNIFAQIMTEFVPIFGLSCDSDSISSGCKATYLSYLGLFAVIMIYFCYRRFEEQVYWQIVLGFARFGVVFLMVGTAAVAIFREETLTSKDTREIPSLKLGHFFPETGVVFSILFLALGFQNTMPNTVQLIQEKRGNLMKMMLAAVVTATGVYFVVGVVVGLAVDDVNQLANMEWHHYSAGFSSPPWYCYPIAYTILLFPVLDVLSVFPIFCITLSDNLIALFYGHDYEGKIHKCEFITFRLVAILPPFFLAAILYNLVSSRQTIILDVVGLLGIVPIMTSISLLQLRTRRLHPAPGKYDTVLGHPVPSTQLLAWCLLVLSLVLFLFCLVCVIVNQAK